jgi:antitoxin component YwqK of YwqJK toxin-antitoxin module
MTKKHYELDEGRYSLIDPELGIHFEEDFSFSSLPLNIEECKGREEFEVHLQPGGEVEKVYSIVEGLKEGPARHFHPGGKLKWEAYYSRGMLHGPSKYFSEMGILLSITWFYQGRQEGAAYQYTIHGSLFSKLSFKGGLFHGIQEHYYEDGSLKSILHYEKGLLHGDVELLFEDGSPKRICQFIHGKKQGIDQIFSKDKIILDEGSYENGLPIGLHIRRFPCGALREEIHYQTPTLFEKKEWNQKGELRGSAL